MHAGVSLQGDQVLSTGVPGTDGLTIERVMDWVEARLEALKTDDDDSEDDATDKDQRAGNSRSALQPRRGGPSSSSSRQPIASSSSSSTHPRPPASSRTTSETKRTARRSPTSDRIDDRPRSSAPPSSRHSSPGSPTQRPTSKPSRKERLASASGVVTGQGGIFQMQNLHHYPFEFVVPGTPTRNPHGLGLITDPVAAISDEGANGPGTTHGPGLTPTTGSKRRHASIAGGEPMAVINATPTRSSNSGQGQGTQNGGGGSRRRNRSGRHSTSLNAPISNGGNDGAMSMVYEPMEVEERARKVPRR